jgi:bile acid-coenzyme A ligase
MAEIVRVHAARDPGRAAIVCGDECVTRDELECRSNRWARAFVDLGVRPGDFVTIALPNCVDFLVAAFASIKAGAVPMPVSHRLAPPERDAILALARPALVVGLDPTAAPGQRVLPAGWVPSPGLDDDPLPVPPLAESWKAMTSGGSTGRPKIIVANAPPEFDPFVPQMRMRIDGTQLVPGPLYHQGPFMFSMYGLFTGATVVLMPRFDPQRALALVEHHRVDWTCFVPTMTHRIWRLPEDVRTRYDLSSLRVVFSTGAPWPVWLKEAWIRWLGPERIVEGYGGTESQGGASITGVEALQRPGSVGRSAGSHRLRILDDDGCDVAPGEIGEIYFMPAGGPGSTYRYIGAQPRAVDGWETLGDLGYLDQDGYLYLVDRRTDLILSGGANVYPAEVEAVLDRHHAVRSSAVIGLPDDDLGQRVHAIVDVGDRPAPSEAELLAHARRHLTPYKVPRSVEIVREPLRDDAGKVRRSGLRAARVEPTPGGAA